MYMYMYIYQHDVYSVMAWRIYGKAEVNEVTQVTDGRRSILIPYHIVNYKCVSSASEQCMSYLLAVGIHSTVLYRGSLCSPIGCST